MLRVYQIGNGLPYSFIVDPNAEFQPGMIGQLGTNGNQIVCGVSDGSAPIGVIDDIAAKSFSAAAVNEVIIVPAAGVSDGKGNLVTPVDVQAILKHANIVTGSFMTNPVDAVLIPTNGVLVFPAGTKLNFSSTGSGVQDSIRTVVNYSYFIPNIPGDNSVIASGRITIWFTRFIGATDQFETNVRYPINAPLFSSPRGLFTTTQSFPEQPSVAMCTASPSPLLSTLEFLWL